MKIGMVTFPEIDTPIITDGWYNLKGWWNPPSFVSQFWANACYIEYTTPDDYEHKAEIIKKSYIESVKSYWKLMVL